jgi:hypothetical protein
VPRTRELASRNPRPFLSLVFNTWGTIAASARQHVNLISERRAPVAQLDRAIASGAIGREFESLRARHNLRYSAALGSSLAESHSLPARCSLTHAKLLRFESLPRDDADLFFDLYNRHVDSLRSSSKFRGTGAAGQGYQGDQTAKSLSAST